MVITICVVYSLVIGRVLAGYVKRWVNFYTLLVNGLLILDTLPILLDIDLFFFFFIYTFTFAIFFDVIAVYYCKTANILNFCRSGVPPTNNKWAGTTNENNCDKYV